MTSLSNFPHMLSEKEEGAIGAPLLTLTAHTPRHMETSVSSSSSLGHVFPGSASGLNVPVEIVDANSLPSPPPLPPPVREGGGEETTVLEQSGPPSHQDEEESMEISLDDISRHASSHSLTEALNVPRGAVGRGEKNGIEDLVLNPSNGPVDSTQLTPVLPSNQQLSATPLSLPGIPSNSVAPPLGPTTPTLSSSPGGLSLGLDGTSLDTSLALQQFTQHFQEMSRSLRSEGIEISPENLASNFPQSLAEIAALLTQSTSSQSSSGGISANLLESMINQSVTQPTLPIDYDIAGVMNGPSLAAPASHPVGRTDGRDDGDIDMVLNEPHVPSSPDSNFDTSELLAPTLTQDIELTTKLANAGPVGVAAAAAILSGRKRKRHVFECNPALRKRHCSKLMRKLKETLDELSTRVGLQACVVTYRPSSKQEKPEPAFKIFGTSPLYGAIEEQKGRILNRMDEQLKKQIPPTPPSSNKQSSSFELPPLVFEGIPTPVGEMTQAQLRGFIPTILKYSTGRGKPGWGKEDMKPSWWPDDVPWQNVRSDVRNEADKKAMPWTDCLRKTILACYTHHGRLDLLEAAVSRKKEGEEEEGGEREGGGGGDGGDERSEAARQLQLQIEQDQSIDFTNVMSSSNGVNELTGTQDQGLSSADQQVFTIDTGVGNCDTSGMPTLADASLAETAARLQQVADETGQVQYATQTVTVTERDSKALGQPVGSTTTVLLTAYPSGHSAVGDTQQQYYGSNPVTNDASTASSSSSAVHNNTSTAPSVQVVYSASVSELPESIVSGITTGPYEERERGVEGPDPASSPGRQALADTNEYLSRATGLSNHDVNIDLASQYISGYTHKPDSLLTGGGQEKDLGILSGEGQEKDLGLNGDSSEKEDALVSATTEQ